MSRTIAVANQKGGPTASTSLMISLASCAICGWRNTLIGCAVNAQMEPFGALEHSLLHASITKSSVSETLIRLSSKRD